MKRIMTVVLTLVLVASLTVGALGAVDLSKKPDDRGPDIIVTPCPHFCTYFAEYNSCCCWACCPNGECVFLGCTGGTGCLQN